MRLLLDTNVLLWFMNDNVRLRPEGRKLMDEAAEIHVSSVSVWEIAIKSRLGRLNAEPDEVVEAMVKNGMLELPVFNRHAIAAGRLPAHHQDPFDRLLIAQAVTEQMCLLTSDVQLRSYSELVKCV